jgi:hypothetical protein
MLPQLFGELSPAYATLLVFISGFGEGVPCAAGRCSVSRVSFLTRVTHRLRCGVAVTARVYDWVVAFCWSFGIGRDLSTATSWAPTEQWPGERHLCFPSYREYKTRQRALWIAERLQSIVGPDYMNRVWRFKVWLSRTRLPLTAPRALGGATELQSEKECLVCLAPPAVRGAPLVAYVCWRARSSRLARRPPSLHLRSRCGMPAGSCPGSVWACIALPKVPA